MDTLRLSWDESFLAYDFGRGHPMSPIRLALTARLCRDLGLLDAPGVRMAEAEPAPDDVLRSVHSARYVDAVRRASALRPDRAFDRAFGLGTSDDPIFAGMHEASARIVGATRDGALAVWRGEAAHAVNFAGGLHHAMPGAASGFCIYNDLAVAITALLEAGAQRIAYVDVDVHHGDGVEQVFWNDPRVLTISVHESPRSLSFPGTGQSGDTGGREAQGQAVNVALPAGTGDAGWLRAFHAVVPVLVRAFEPQILITQHGCDSHFLDPLAHLALSIDGQRDSYSALHDLAHEVCAGRWVATGGGGYEVVDVVPRAWAHLVAIAAHQPLPDHTVVPPGWRDYVREALRRVAPAHLLDGTEPVYRSWSSGYDPSDPLDRAVMATRKAVLPLHGLDPWFD